MSNPTKHTVREWEKGAPASFPFLELIARIILFFQAVIIAYIGHGHLFKPEANLPEMGFTFKPRREDSKERILLLRHMCAILGASHLARSGVCILAIFTGGTAVVCGLVGEIVFLCTTVYAFRVHPPGTGVKGSPVQGPTELMYGLLCMNAIGLVLAVISRVRRKLKPE